MHALELRHLSASELVERCREMRDSGLYLMAIKATMPMGPYCAFPEPGHENELAARASPWGDETQLWMDTEAGLARGRIRVVVGPTASTAVASAIDEANLSSLLRWVSALDVEGRAGR